MTIRPMCYARYKIEEESLPVTCDKNGTDKCPVHTGNYSKLKEEPCCAAIFIPVRFVTQADQNLQKAARYYIEECLSELTQALPEPV